MHTTLTILAVTGGYLLLMVAFTLLVRLVSYLGLLFIDNRDEGICTLLIVGTALPFLGVPGLLIILSASLLVRLVCGFYIFLCKQLDHVTGDHPRYRKTPKQNKDVWL